jgi:hypothetical protein
MSPLRDLPEPYQVRLVALLIVLVIIKAVMWLSGV